jgi:LmbE family N-acetylglucosaminyl deacetylase
VLGCGGYILRRVSEGHEVEVVVASISSVNRPGQALKSSAEARTREMEEAARRLGTACPRVLLPGHENRLDTLPIIEVMTILDVLLSAKRYEEVLVPYPSHHQDHRVCFDAAFGALREKGSPNAPSLIALYEYPYIGWTAGEVPGGKLYVDITTCIDAKLHALAAYESQVCEPPHPTSLHAVRTLAAMRGMECGRSFAELFYILKMVV